MVSDAATAGSLGSLTACSRQYGIITGMPHWIATPHIPPDHRGPVDRPFVPFKSPAGDTSLLERLAATVRHRPESIAFVDADAVVTFADLWQRTRRLADAIRAAGPDEGPVGILLPGDSWYVVAVLACVFVGRVAVLLDASFPAARNLGIVATSGLSLLIARRNALPLPPSGVSTLDPDGFVHGGGQPATSYDFAGANRLDEPAFILSTSGSSGQPKLVAHSERTMLHWARTVHDGMHVSADDRVLSLSLACRLSRHRLRFSQTCRAPRRRRQTPWPAVSRMARS